MKDYWSKLPLSKRGKNERFNFIMDHIEEVSSNTPNTSQPDNGSTEPKTDDPVIEEPVNIISEDDITVVAGENTLEIILEKEKATYSEDTETFDEEGGL